MGLARPSASLPSRKHRFLCKDQMANVLPMCLHLSDFSWHKNSSLKDDPEARTCTRIAEEVVKERLGPIRLPLSTLCTLQLSTLYY